MNIYNVVSKDRVGFFFDQVYHLPLNAMSSPNPEAPGHRGSAASDP